MKPVVVVPLAIVLIAGAVLLWIRSRRAMHPQAQARPVRCAECGHEFIPSAGEKGLACPQCGSTDRIILWWYECRGCGEQFVGVEERLKDHTFRFPGGEWRSPGEFNLTPTCPKCGSRRVKSIRMPDKPGN